MNSTNCLLVAAAGVAVAGAVTHYCAVILKKTHIRISFHFNSSTKSGRPYLTQRITGRFASVDDDPKR